jgi:prepilin-type N-terminal cleavage/methylation domain-containing protein
MRFNTIILKKLCGFTLVELMIVVLIISMLLAIATPSFVNARQSARARACVDNLKNIDSSKQQYIMDNRTSGTCSFLNTDIQSGGLLNPIYIRTNVSCPAGVAYTVGSGTVNPTCSYGTTDGLKFVHQLT